MTTHPSTQNIKLATDAVIFTVIDGDLKVLLIQMKKQPYSGMWAVPGGLLEDEEVSEDTVKRILREQTGVSKVYLEQLRAFDAVDRDTLGRVVSIAYFALIPSDSVGLKTTDKYADVQWVSVKKLPKLAYDHEEIVKVATQTLQTQLQQSNIAWSLLPKEFPIRELHELYELILGKEIDIRNFRKKLLALGFIEGTGKQNKDGAHRPAELYKFSKRSLETANIL